MSLKRACAVLVIMSLWPGIGQAQQLYTLETEHLRLIYYDQAHRYILPHLARSFENAFGFHRRLFDYTPNEKVTILFHDFNDYGGGGTSTLPWNYIMLGMEPMDYVYETQPTNERMNWLINHELVHLVETDNYSARQTFFRRLFRGKVSPSPENPISLVYSYLASPRWYAPRWYHEGIAVFLETWMAGGLGRAMGGYDEMLFRTMVRDDARFYDFVGIESEGSTADFQIGQISYLYGTRFMSYLAYTYSPDKVMDWVRIGPGAKAGFSAQFRHVFGASIDDVWSQWIDFEKVWQTANLDSVRQYSATTGRRLVDKALGSVSRSFFDQETGLIYSAILYQGTSAHLAAIDPATGTLTRLTNVEGPALYYVTSLAFDSEAGILFYTSDNSKGWRDLRSYDIRKGQKQLLQKDLRAGDLAFNRADKSLWGVQHHNGYSRVIRIAPPYTEASLITVLPYGQDMTDLDISPDGRLLSAAMTDISGKNDLIVIELDAFVSGSTDYRSLFEFDNSSPAGFTFSDDGRYLTGSSYYTGVSNIFRYDFQTEEMEVLTNAESGYFRPIPLSADSLVCFEYTGAGFVPVMLPVKPLEDVAAVNYLGLAIVLKHPRVKEWNVGSPAGIDLEALTTYDGPYRILQQTRISHLYPVVQSYRNALALGLYLNAADPLGLGNLDLTASYSAADTLDQKERLHLNAQYRYWDWTVSASYNRADFYDLFGPTMSSRRGYSLGLAYNRSLSSDAPAKLNLGIKATLYGDLDALPDFQNELLGAFDRYISVGASLSYSRFSNVLGGLEPTKGISWSLNLNGNYVNDLLFPKLMVQAYFGIPTPITFSSLWIQPSAGYSMGEASESFANFYFGGFGNNWVDYQDAERWREVSAFPGMGLQDTDITEYPSGIAYAKVMGEFRLPPIRFRRLGLPSLYANWLKITPFAALLWTSGAGDSASTYSSLGVQADLHLVLFSGLNTTFSMGYALARRLATSDISVKKYSPELMISLKIL
ncbi:MAG: hypothetical protein IIA59_07535 [Candidatus Marinimicrobia bacterium]|nr:hypothetical protein [Candidatus Neomarinimicrobiota bacterium]